MNTSRSSIALIVLAAAVASDGCNRTPPPPKTATNSTVPSKRRRVPYDETLVVNAGGGQAGGQTVDAPTAAHGVLLNSNFGLALQHDALQGGKLTQVDGRWRIEEGEFRLKPQSVGGDMDPALKVDAFATTENEVICQLDAGMDRNWRLGERGLEDDKPIRLQGDQGNEFPAIGYVYSDANDVVVRFTPGTPLKGLADLPHPLSRSDKTQKCKLIFRVTKGATITGVLVGEKLVIRYLPRFHVNGEQKPR